MAYVASKLFRPDIDEDASCAAGVSTAGQVLRLRRGLVGADVICQNGQTSGK